MYCNRKGAKTQVHLPHTSLSILSFSNVSFLWAKKATAQACKWFIFKMYISETFNEMRGNGFINNVFFLGFPILIGFHRLADAQDVMGLMTQVWRLLPPVCPYPHFFGLFFNLQNTIIVNWRDPSHKQLGQLCDPVASKNWTEDPSGLLFPGFLPDAILTELWTLKSTLCLSERSRTMVNSIYNDLILLFGSLHSSPVLAELGSWPLHTEWLSWWVIFLRP